MKEDVAREGDKEKEVEWEIYRLRMERFMDEMKKRFLQKQEEGWGGWSDPAYMESMRERMKEKAKDPSRKDLVDIGNFALFLYFLKEPR